jgi:hypothetical protein
MQQIFSYKLEECCTSNSANNGGLILFCAVFYEMEVPRPAYGFEFGEPPKDIRSSYDVVVIGLGGTNSDLRNPGGGGIQYGGAG